MAIKQPTANEDPCVALAKSLAITAAQLAIYRKKLQELASLEQHPGYGRIILDFNALASDVEKANPKDRDAAIRRLLTKVRTINMP